MFTFFAASFVFHAFIAIIWSSKNFFNAVIKLAFITFALADFVLVLYMVLGGANIDNMRLF